MQSLSSSPAHQRRTVVMVTSVGAAANVLLAGSKIVVGLVAESQALVADGVHSLSDLITDAVVLLGAMWWTKPPDAGHPYGHGRVETLVNLFIGAALALTAVGLGWEGLTSIAVGDANRLEWPALVVAATSILTKELLFKWTARRGQRVRSPALVANAWHHRSDALSSVPVLLAVVVSWVMPGLLFLDQVAAILVATMLLGAAWNIARPSLNELTEASQDPKLLRRVTEIAEQFPEIRSVHRVRMRRVGGSVFVDLHMLLDPMTPVVVAHETSHRFQEAVQNDQPQVMEVIAHIEPSTSDTAGNWGVEEPHARSVTPRATGQETAGSQPGTAEPRDFRHSSGCDQVTAKGLAEPNATPIREGSKG